MNGVADDRVDPEKKVAGPPQPIEQPIGAISYAILGFLNLLVAIAIAVGIFYASRQIADQPSVRLFNYVLLAVLGITSALFLFGAMRSGAALTSRKLDMSVELGGPVVIAVLVVVGGYYFTRMPEKSPLTFQLPADSALASQLSAEAKLIVDLPGRREIVTFDANGEGMIREVSYSDIGQLMQITLQSSEFNFEKNQHTINIQIPANWNVPLKLEHVSADEKKQQELKGVYTQLIEDINLELVRKDAMLFPAIEDYLRNPSEVGWSRVKAAAADSEERINASLDKELELRSSSELIDARRQTAASINGAPQVRQVVQPQRPVLNNVFQTHQQRVEILDIIPKLVLPSTDEVIRWRDNMKIRYLEMKVMVSAMIQHPEI